MLDHWVTALSELGVPRRAASSALHTIEKAVLKSVPAAWGAFTTAVHESGADPGRAPLNDRVEALFCDWASDQPEPIPITRAEVGRLTMRAKSKWLRKHTQVLAKRRANPPPGPTSKQPRIDGLFKRKATSSTDANVREKLATLAFNREVRQIAARSANARRRHAAQPTLRDFGFEAETQPPNAKRPKHDRGPRPLQPDRHGAPRRSPPDPRRHPIRPDTEPLPRPPQPTRGTHDPQTESTPDITLTPDQENADYAVFDCPAD